MTVAGDDPTPWKQLADGTIVAIDREDDVIAITVERGATRERLYLYGCDAIRYLPLDEPPLYELDDIAASEPDIRDAAFEKGAIAITGGAGTLYLTYANLRRDG